MAYYSSTSNGNDVFFEGNYIPQMSSNYDFYQIAPESAASAQLLSSIHQNELPSTNSSSSSQYWRTDWGGSQLPAPPAPSWPPTAHQHVSFNNQFGNQCYPESSQSLPAGNMVPKKNVLPSSSSSIRPLVRITPKPFRCHICFKAFSQAANLTAHKRIHTGEKPFMCPTCHRPFSQSSSLVTHRRTHTGERPYPCAKCDKAFTDSSTLTKHLRTHTGIKPYACPLCMMRFTQSGNLHRHMKTHKQ